jgi:hypothetical protein
MSKWVQFRHFLSGAWPNVGLPPDSDWNGDLAGGRLQQPDETIVDGVSLLRRDLRQGAGLVLM